MRVGAHVRVEEEEGEATSVGDGRGAPRERSGVLVSMGETRRVTVVAGVLRGLGVRAIGQQIGRRLSRAAFPATRSAMSKYHGALSATVNCATAADSRPCRPLSPVAIRAIAATASIAVLLTLHGPSYPRLYEFS